MNYPSFLALLLAASLQVSLADPSAEPGTESRIKQDPLGEFCDRATNYLVDYMRGRTDETKRELKNSWQSVYERAEKSVQEWDKAYGHLIREGLPGDRKSAMKAFNKWFSEAGEKLVDAQKKIGAHLQEKPVKVSDLKKLGVKLGSKANGLLKGAQGKLKQLRDEACATVLLQEAELKRIHSQVEGLSVSLESIPSNRGDCMAVVSNQRVARKCRASGSAVPEN